MVERILFSPGGSTESKQDVLIAAIGDPATADTVRELLTRIHTAVDGLELSADTLNLNVDGVEAALATLNGVDYATDAGLTTIKGVLDTISAAVASPQTDALTNTELRATPVPVSGTVTVANPSADPETGLATEATLGLVATAANQLPDGHNVAVNNDPAAIALSASTASLTSAAPLTISPSVGTDALRLWWVSVIPDTDNEATGYATVSLGADELYRAPALAHRQRFDGAAGEDIVVTIVGEGDFLVTVHYLEFTP